MLTVGQLDMCARPLPVSLTLAENCKMEANGTEMNWFLYDTALQWEDIRCSGLAVACMEINTLFELK